MRTTWVIIYHLLTASEVITGNSQTERQQGQYIKAEVCYFPVMTERTRLISYLSHDLFSAILKKNTIKTPEVIFHIRLRALVFSLRTLSYGSSFFPLRFMAHLGHKSKGKKLGPYNLQYVPRTRLERGISDHS